MQFKFFLFNLVVTFTAFLLMWIANYPRRLRYRQVYFPVLAFILSAIAVVFYEIFFPFLRPIFVKGVNVVLDIFFSPVPGDLGYFPEYALAFLAVLVFVSIKLVRSLILRLGLLVRRIFGFILKKMKKRQGKVSGSPTLAYRIDEKSEESAIVLKEQWEFIYLFLRKISWLIAGIVLFSIIAQHLISFPFESPIMTILALMIILEGVWYLNGDRPRLHPGEFIGENAATETIGDYTGLWEEYQKRWREKLLAADQSRAPAPPVIKKENLLGIFKPGEENAEELIIGVSNLLNDGYDLTPQDCFILKELYRGNDLIIADAEYNHIAPVIITSFIRSILRGQNVLIIIPYANIHRTSFTQKIMEWTKDWFMKLPGHQNEGEINFFSRFGTINKEDRILISTADDLLEKKTINDEWFSNLKTVLFVDVSEVFARSLTSSSILLSILRKRNETIQCVVLSNYRQALEPSVRRNLDIKKGTEIRLMRDKALLTSLLVWRLEGQNTFQEKLLYGDIGRFLGAEAVLAVLPWRDDLENIYLFCQEKVCWDEYLEELENFKSSIDEQKISLETIKRSQARERILCSHISYLLERKERMILFSRDDEYNLVTNLLRGNSYANKEILYHIVSPPYLLREYMADNIEYFRKTPIFALTAKMMVGKFSLALSLMERLILRGLTEEEILSEIHRIKPEASSDASKELRELFKVAFNGIDIFELNYLKIETRYEFDKTSFDEQYIFKLSPEIKNKIQLNWINRIKICDQQGNTMDEIYMDHLYQNYLLDQVHTFSQKPYRIGTLDKKSFILRVSHVSPVNITYYRPEIVVLLQELQAPVLEEHKFTETFDDFNVRLELCEAKFIITTTGYYFPEGKSMKKTPLKGGKQRVYSLGRVLKIDFHPGENNGIDGTVVSANLAVLLKELLVSFFPETHQYIIVCSSTSAKELVFSYPILFPQFTWEKAMEKETGQVNLFLFEDSHQDLGLVQSIYDKWKYIFKVLDDYISWVIEGGQEEETAEAEKKEQKFEIERGQISPEDRKPSIDRYRFLKFHSDKLPSFIDLGMTSAFLRILVGDNDLTKARKEFYSPKEEEIILTRDVHQCDFCAKPLPTAERHVLDDGREQCKACKDSAVKELKGPSLPNLVAVYNEARVYFKKELRLEVRENISVEFTTAKKVAEHLGTEFESSPKYDPRVVGFAVSKGKKHIIKIENGSPHHLTLATMVHELTHIWQFDNLDFKKMETEHGKLLVEGHAVWAELNCLEVNGLAKEYRKETANRKDEYGEGYQKILQLLEENKTYRNPFEMLKEMFPLH